MRNLAVVALLCAALATPGAAQESDLVILDAWATPARVGQDSHVYLTLANRRPFPYAVLRTSTQVSAEVVALGLGATGPDGESLPSAFYLPPGRAVRMIPGKPHLILGKVNTSLVVGGEVQLLLHGLGDEAVPVTARIRAAPSPQLAGFHSSISTLP